MQILIATIVALAMILILPALTSKIVSEEKMQKYFCSLHLGWGLINVSVLAILGFLSLPITLAFAGGTFGSWSILRLLQPRSSNRLLWDRQDKIHLLVSLAIGLAIATVLSMLLGIGALTGLFVGFLFFVCWMCNFPL